MLSSSAEETGKTINVGAIVNPAVDSGVAGGRQLIALGLGAAGTQIDTGLVDAVAAEIGREAAVDAAAVAGAFEHLNRIVDGSGLRVGKAAKAMLQGHIDVLGLDRFPHADL